MKNVICVTFCVTLIVLLTSGDGLLSFAQDEHTVLLYTFETSAGKTVKDLSGNGNDLSGNGNDGELMGPSGVKATLMAALSSKEMARGTS